MDSLASCPCVRRYEKNPVLSARDVPYDCTLVFNAGVIRWQGQYVMVFRNDYGYIARGSFTGTNIGLALSPDGIHWQVEKTWRLWSGQASTKEEPRMAANAVGKRQ